MQTQVKQLDFSGQNIYCGLDVHKRQVTVTVMVEELNYTTFSQSPPDPLGLVKYLKKNFPNGTYHAAYEAGFSGFWYQEALASYGVNCLIANAADVPTTDKDRKQKRDPRDSRKLAKALKNADIIPIYIPSKKTQHDRALLRTRSRIVGNLTRCKNRIKSYLYFLGIEYPELFSSSKTHWSKAFMEWLRGLDLKEDSGNIIIKTFLTEAEFLRGLLLQTNREIRQLSRTKHYAKMANLLIKIPGVGCITAMTILAELENIKRFKKLDHLCSYVGLIPNVSSSDTKVHVGDITKRCNGVLRSMLVESSWIAIRHDPALTLKYNELCVRMTGNKAIIRIARKLLNRIRYVLVHEQEYQKAIVS